MFMTMRCVKCDEPPLLINRDSRHAHRFCGTTPSIADFWTNLAPFALSKYRVDVVLRELVRRQPSPHRPSNTWLHNGGNPKGEDHHHSHPTQTRLTVSGVGGPDF
jgi:hypothetical protein